MPRIFAIDWDRHEVRGLLVSSGPTGTSVIGAWSAPLATSDPAGLSGKQIGMRLADAMNGEPIGKAITLVGVGRDHVQMKLLTLPPAPPDELPEMVRFQAEREFTALGEEAALDFIPHAGDESTAHQLLAFALNPAGISEARDVCTAFDVEPARIPLRACVAAALVERAGLAGGAQLALVVNPLIDEADIVVQSGDKVYLMRTVRLPELKQREARQRALVAEIRRTMAAVRQQVTDRQIDSVVISGNQDTLDHPDNFGAELGISVTMFDPVAHAPSGFTSQQLSSEVMERFSAVLGMALDEADRTRPIVDFANPRKRGEKRRFGRTQILAITAASLVVLAIVFSMWRQYSDPGKELERINARIAEAEKQVELYKNVTAQAKAVNRWLATDVNWLDELEHFARKIRPKPLTEKDFPIEQDAVMTQLTLIRPPGAEAVGGRMDLQAVAKSPAAVADLEQRLRDARHRVTTGVGKQDRSVPGYGWSFGLDVQVTPTVEESQPVVDASGKAAS